MSEIIEEPAADEEAKKDVTSPELSTFLEAEEQTTETPAVAVEADEGTEALSQTSMEQTENMKSFGEKLGIEIPSEVLALSDNAAISAGLVETAINAGKSEDEISAAMGAQ